MKKILLFFFFLASVFSQACPCLSFKEAQKKALLANKFILVHFGNYSQIEMGMPFLKEVQSAENSRILMENFIYVCVPKERSETLYKKFHINDSQTVLIVDANGVELFKFSNFESPENAVAVLQNFSFADPFLGNDLNNFHKNKSYNTALRLAQKYYDYSIVLDKNLKKHVFKAAEFYLDEAEAFLSKKDPILEEKNQKIALLKLYRWAYLKNFSLLNQNLQSFLEASIYENNKSAFYFLKYITAKVLHHNDFTEIAAQANQVEGFDYFIKKSALILEEKELTQSN